MTTQTTPQATSEESQDFIAQYFVGKAGYTDLVDEDEVIGVLTGWLADEESEWPKFFSMTVDELLALDPELIVKPA
jgi:hypothetical protein